MLLLHRNSPGGTENDDASLGAPRIVEKLPRGHFKEGARERPDVRGFCVASTQKYLR
jgi:hypothetical protein